MPGPITNAYRSETAASVPPSECVDLESQALSTFDVGSLRLTGVGCNNLTELNLNYNSLSSLPCDLADALPRLRSLHLCGNDLKELPSCIGALKDLQILTANENEICNLPVSLFQSFNLVELHLLGNRLTHLHDDICQLRTLRSLTIEDNQLEELPGTFGQLQNLQVLEASENNLEFLPKNFGSLVNLSILNLSRNKLVELPDSFCDLPSLQNLDVSNNSLSQIAPRLASASRCLLKLFASDNVLSRFPPWIGELHHIQELSLGNNYIVDELPEDFGAVTGSTLRHLDLGANHIECLPSTMGQLVNVETLHLGSHILELERRAFQNGNSIVRLPESFGDMRNLRHLRLDENQLCCLPENIGDLQCLEFIDIGQNVVAELPASFCRLTRLKTAYLSRNRISRLPEDFGNLASLEILRLNANLLRELPSSFCRLRSLKTLNLIDNRLPDFPPCLNQLCNLMEVAIMDNNFDYDIPEVTRFSVAKYPEDGIHKFVRTTGSGIGEENGLMTSALALAVQKGKTAFKAHINPSDQPDEGMNVVETGEAETGVAADGEGSAHDDTLGNIDADHHGDVDYINHNQEEAENWDMEIDDGNPFSCDEPITYRHAPPQRSPQGKDILDFMFIPSEEHPPCLPVPDIEFDFEDGQFDDA